MYKFDSFMQIKNPTGASIFLKMLLRREQKVINKNVITTPEIEINENQDNKEAKDDIENKDISEVTN